MPYIYKAKRAALVEHTRTPQTPGELNYIITSIINNYYKQYGGYAAINDVLGALEGAKLEFYRRVVAPYEDQKIQENGDVY
jgi:hypothetical protein